MVIDQLSYGFVLCLQLLCRLARSLCIADDFIKLCDLRAELLVLCACPADTRIGESACNHPKRYCKNDNSQGQGPDMGCPLSRLQSFRNKIDGWAAESH